MCVYDTMQWCGALTHVLPSVQGINVLDTEVATGAAPTSHTFNGSFASRTDYTPGRHRLDTAQSTQPWKPGENMHGPGGTDTVAEGYRLWTTGTRVEPNQTEDGCVHACINVSRMYSGLCLRSLPVSLSQT